MASLSVSSTGSEPPYRLSSRSKTAASSRFQRSSDAYTGPGTSAAAQSYADCALAASAPTATMKATRQDPPGSRSVATSMPRRSSDDVGASTPCRHTAPVVGEVNASRPRPTSGATVAPDSYGDSPSLHGPSCRVTVEVQARPSVTGRRTPDRLRTSMSTTTAETSWTQTV